MDITLQELKTMKAKQLRRIIREAIYEVLSEGEAEDRAADAAAKANQQAQQKSADSAEKAAQAAITAAKAKKAAVTADKNPGLLETDLDEMARLAKGFRLADPNFDASQYANKRVSGVSMADIINFFRENPGAEKTALQSQFGFVRPQIANAVVNGLLDAGVLVKLGAGGEVEATPEPGEEQPETIDGPEAFLIGSGDLSKYFSSDSNDNAGDEEDFNDEEEPTAGEIGGQPVSTSSMSDEDYEAFMKYDELKQRLDSTKSNILKMKRSKGGVAGDIRDTSSSDIERLQALKTTLQSKIDALIANSDYLKKKTGQEITAAPEIEDIEDEETLKEYNDRMYEMRKLQYYAGIRK
jgi:hypothetical protein